eukprot:6469004-Amphidinium_carterae.1
MTRCCAPRLSVILVTMQHIKVALQRVPRTDQHSTYTAVFQEDEAEEAEDEAEEAATTDSKLLVLIRVCVRASVLSQDCRCSHTVAYTSKARQPQYFHV